MAIEKNSFKVMRFDSECSPRSRDTMSSDEDEVRRRNSGVESDDDDEFDDADSGAGSDDFDLLELGETGAEFCQIGNQTCSIPLELYDLPGLEDILSVDVWNECLSEDERFELAKYLPDMDQENFVRTLKELFTGCNLHFGSPIKKLFEMLKGGLCEPRVALYREGLNFLQKRQHYHRLRKHQNTMVSNLCQIRDAWFNCRGYSIEERLRVLNIMKSQKSLMHEKMEDLEVDSSDEESGEGIWSRKNKNKDRKAAQKIGRYPFHGVGSGMEFDPRQPSVAMEQEKYGKQNPKGMLRLAGSKTSSAKVPTGHVSSVYHGLDMNPGLNGSVNALSRQNKPAGYDSGSLFRMRDQLRNGDDDEEMSYGLSVHRDRLRSNLMDKSGVMRMGKRHDLLRGDEVDTDHLMGLPLSSKGELQGYNRNANQPADMKMFTAKPSTKRGSFDFPRKAQYPETVQQFVGSDQVRSRLRGSQMPLKGNLVDSSDYNELFYNSKMPGDEYGMDSTFKYDEWNRRGKKWKTGRDSPDLGYNAYRSSSPQVSDRFLSSDFRAKSLQEKVRGTFIQNGSKATEALRGNQMFLRGEETESDSSEQLNDDDDDDSPLMLSKFAYLMGTADGSRKKSLKSHLDPNKAKFVRTDVKALALTQSKKKGGFADQGDTHGVENYLSKAKQKGKIRNGGPFHNLAGKVMEERYPSGSDMLSDGDDDWRQVIGKNGRMRGEPAEMLDMPLSNAFAAERKKKGKISLDHSTLRPKYLHDYVGNEDDSLEKQLLLDDNGVGNSKFKRKGQKYVAYKGDQNDRSEAPLLGCSSAMKKRKLKDEAADLGGRDEDANLLSNTLPQNDSTSLKRKSKKKPEVEMVTPDIVKSELPVADMGNAGMELETKPQKKQFILITPTVHTGFSFSIMHLLTAVRMAMTSPLTEGSLEVGKPSEEQNKAQEGSGNGIPSNDMVADNGEPADQPNNTPSLNVQEIVNRVRSNPGDPCILETQEPLQDLVRGVLKIFSSKTAPLGAKGWKALTVYEKSSRSWSWVGPVLHNSSDHDTIEEVTSPEAWGLPHKMLVKLVDSFANWLKCGQETLQQIGSLPEPPLALMQVNLDEKERFRDLRAQKSLNTISPSSEEVRTYFRKEEVLRYSIPDRAFSYTAADGKKSIVAPLRRCGGKPTSKARDHFMLKRDRPPHVTILCLVRDAAARLPGSIGTRADVCTLIRDSQYIVEDVSDAQINQVVSGALDRLHYERDPCVQFDGERKLWVYLHRDREEEDFEDDGTSSTKKWKRQKKDAADQSDQGAATADQGAATVEQGTATVDQGTATVAQPGIGEQSGIDLCSDLNVYPPGIDEDKGMELLSNDARLNAEDLVDVSHAEDLVEVNHASEGINLASEDANVCEGDSMTWEATLGLNPSHELCQENSTNADFDDESFGRERPVGLQSASLL